WRARLLANRALRVPFLLAERAIAPLDLSGLVSSPERVLRHLLGAHHDANQFAYDLEMLAAHPGWVARVRDAARAVVEQDTPRARWLRDLCVHEGYHASLAAAADAALRGELGLSDAERDDPDVSFLAYLRWCAAQPETPEEAWRLFLAGRYDVERGVLPSRVERAGLDAADVARMSPRELRALFAAGHPVRPADLAGYAFRGVSLGLPAVVERLTWTTFQKVFVPDATGAGVVGFNVRVEQRGTSAPSEPLRRRGSPRRFGPFRVVGAADHPGVELDYGAAASPLDPLGALRDPVVAVNAGSTDLLLGRSWLAIGPARVPTPSFFTLERERRVDVAYGPTASTRWRRAGSAAARHARSAP
ncbi:MAG TPA: hypothetical protein VHB21_00005, partial [Minicystis sp.]|nr:hypothetical protein [Minicystis sp.]